MLSDPRTPAAPATTTHSSPGGLGLWLASALLSLLFVLLYTVFGELQADLSRLQACIQTGQVLRVSRVAPEELAALRAWAEREGATEELLQATLARGQRGNLSWLAVMQRVVPVPPSEVHVTSLVQHGGTLTVRGTVTGAPALEAYVARLRGSSLFSNVQVDSAADTFAITLLLDGYQP